MNVTETKPLDQPAETSSGRQPSPSSRTQLAESNAPATPVPVNDESGSLESFALMIGFDACDDAAIYLHRANTHHDGE
ncbi:hypothetical protein [Rhodopirellula baltica]